MLRQSLRSMVLILSRATMYERLTLRNRLRGSRNQGRDELDRAAPGGGAAVALVRIRAALLPLPAHRSARDYGLGAGEAGARGGRRRRAVEASLRLLLHQ